jgi:hypothetical protein
MLTATVHLMAGDQPLKILAAAPGRGFNINWIKFWPVKN